jgi:O-antigen/teichoic acid export membrane protein
MKRNWNEIRGLFARFKDLTSLGVANLISSGISGIFWFYIASLVGTSNYGEISYLIAICSIASTISMLGVGNTVIVYTAKGEKVQSTAFFLAVSSGIIASIVLFFIFYNVGVSIFVIGYVIFSLSTAEILGRKLYRDYSKYLITQKILLVIFALGFYFLIGPQGVILGYAISFLPYFERIYKGFKEYPINISLLKPRTGFIINSYVLDLSRTFSGQTDKLLVAPLLGFSLLGNYQLGIQFLSLLGLIPSIVYQYILPQDASGRSNKKLKKVIVLVSVLLALLGIGLSPIVLPYLFPKFTHAIHVIQIVSLGVIPSTINLMYISKLIGREKSKIVLIGSGIYLVVQVLSILTLGKIYAVNGVATAIVLAMSAESTYLFLVNRYLEKTDSHYIIDKQPEEHHITELEPSNVTIEQNQTSQEISKTEFIGKKQSFFSRKPLISLLIIGVIGLILRIHYLPSNVPLTLDALAYFFYASDTSILGHLPVGNALVNNGWPAFLSVFFSVFHSSNFMDYMVLQRLITVLISTLTVIPVYLLCRKFFNQQYSLIGSAIFSFEPRIIQNSVLGITEPLYILLITVASVLFLNNNKKLNYISFAVIALSALVRAEGLVLFVAFSIMFFVRYRKENRIILKYVFAVGVFLLSILPMIFLRIESTGKGVVPSYVSSSANGILTTSAYGDVFSSQVIPGTKIFVSLLGWSLVPIFIFFVPLGAFLIYKHRNREVATIIVIILFLLAAAFFAYYNLASDTRYLYPLFPFLCIVSLFTIKSLTSKFRNDNTLSILLNAGFFVASIFLIHLKNEDVESQMEAYKIASYVDSSTSGINPNSSVSYYLTIAEMKDQKFPLLSTQIPPGPKIVSTDGFESLSEYIKFGKENGLTHLVLDGSKRSPAFLNDVFYNEEKYPYLIKTYDSWDHGYKYHLKIYKINYDAFNSTFTKSLQ